MFGVVGCCVHHHLLLLSSISQPGVNILIVSHRVEEKMRNTKCYSENTKIHFTSCCLVFEPRCHYAVRYAKLKKYEFHHGSLKVQNMLGSLLSAYWSNLSRLFLIESLAGKPFVFSCCCIVQILWKNKGNHFIIFLHYDLCIKVVFQSVSQFRFFQRITLGK